MYGYGINRTKKDGSIIVLAKSLSLIDDPRLLK